MVFLRLTQNRKSGKEGIVLKIDAVITPEIRRGSKRLKMYEYNSIKAFMLSVAAVISGVAVYTAFTELLNEKINDVFMEHLDYVENTLKSDILYGLIFNCVIYVILLLMFSTSVIGTPYIYAITFIKILGIAVTASHLYFNYGIKGIEYSIIVFMPGKIFLIMATLILIDYSTYISNRIRAKENTFDSLDVKKLSVWLIVLLLIMALSVAVDFFTTSFFSDLFNF